MIPAWARRAIVEPLWARVSGSPRLEEWRELEATQYLPLDVLRARQDARVRELLSRVCRDTPFYRRRYAEAGVSPSDVRSVADLTRLPIVTKQDIRSHAAEFRSTAVHSWPVMEFRTGGSTGVPLILLATEEVSERRNAAARRADRWTSWEVGEPVAAVWGNPKLPTTLKERLRHKLLEPMMFLDTMELTRESVVEFARAWRRFRPTLLFGHAHSIYLLACSIRDLGIDTIRPKAVLSTSMMLLAPERQVIEQVLNVKVTDRYGCEEVGLIGCECERHAGMHINADHVVVEFLRDDGTPAQTGELAHVVVTDLLNDAMPLIRYKVDDLASALATPCPCGRGLPLMERVAGRVADFLVREDGAKVAGVSLIENTLTKMPGIDQMQIVQEELRHIRVRVVPAPTFGNETGTELVEYFSRVFPGADVELDLTTTIAKESNGKYRFAICRVDA